MRPDMNWPYELQIGWRYTRSGRAGRRNGFISFISAVSMAGIALGVAALIIVLSVMNGFQKEVRDRMLGVVSHIEIYGPGGGVLEDVNRTLAEARRRLALSVELRTYQPRPTPAWAEAARRYRELEGAAIS